MKKIIKGKYPPRSKGDLWDKNGVIYKFCENKWQSLTENIKEKSDDYTILKTEVESLRKVIKELSCTVEELNFRINNIESNNKENENI